MKKLFGIAFVFLAAIVFFESCSDVETYAEKKKKEKAAINAFLTSNDVEVITEEQFIAQDYTTDVSKNQYVRFDGNGIYLQIIRKGCGKPLADGEQCDVLCRFSEYNLMTDTLQLSNNLSYFSSLAEKMTVMNTSGTFSGSFVTGESLMYSSYSSASVPAGWLFPLAYINLGWPEEVDDEIAKIKVIVPSAQGQVNASQYVYPCLYEITYQRGL